ncbi:helix-turn-helix transcriptional regulator [Flavobacterium sp. RSB2_4_14]|uniref:helix-turn-helix transcriptional regulator n=1 Tax=Flavobacterium sp. RSB2_4_14 TaxID=3447665 RepID=UPI003F32DAAC
MVHKNLRKARKTKGLTQKQMADGIAMEQTTYSKKERGISPIRNEEWIRFAKILEVTVEDIRDKDLPIENIQDDKNHILIPKNAFEIIIKYNNKLEEENNTLKEQLKTLTKL